MGITCSAIKSPERAVQYQGPLAGPHRVPDHMQDEKSVRPFFLISRGEGNSTSSSALSWGRDKAVGRNFQMSQQHSLPEHPAPQSFPKTPQFLLGFFALLWFWVFLSLCPHPAPQQALLQNSL